MIIAAGPMLAPHRTLGPGATAPARETVPPRISAAPTSATMGVLRLGSAPTDAFTRVRVTDDDTRLNLSYPAAAGTVTGTIEAAPAYYGVDFNAYPPGKDAPALLQDLFDNTPLAYLGYYFQTAGGHPDDSWAGKIQDLLGQGWALLPIYVGRQQGSHSPISSSEATARTQGTDDGRDAVSKAKQQKLPAHARIFLDIEATLTSGRNAAPDQSTIAYIEAWLSAVNGDGSYAAALYDTNASWQEHGQAEYDAPVLRSMMNSKPVTWVSWGLGAPPTGISTHNWPLDNNGDPCAVAVREYSKTKQWQFASFAQIWQYAVGYNPSSMVITTDTGANIPVSDIAHGIDLNAALSPDPGQSRPANSRPKATRRPQVSKVAASPAAVKAGSAVNITVSIDRQAPAPNGTLILLRTDATCLAVPTSVRVAAGETTATATAQAIYGTSGKAVISCRTLYQLNTPPATVTVSVSAG